MSAMSKNAIILLFGVGLFCVQASANSRSMECANFDVRSEHYDPGISSIRSDSASLDSLIDYRMLENHIPGVATIAIKDGQIIWNRSFGYAVLEDSIPVADSTLFYLASISKTSVAIVLMQLWEQNLLDLDDDVGGHLGFPVRNPYYPDSVISIRMCMTHMSSINDNWNVLDPLNIQGDSPIPLGEFLEDYLVPGGLYYSIDNYNPWPPATEDDYCNIGAAICGYIIEQLADSFPMMCRDSLFDPLDMNETAWFIAELDTNNIAMPYHWDGAAYIPYGHIGKPYYPCGTLRTSSLQLSRLLIAFMQHGVIDDTVRILESTSVDSMTTSQYPVLNPEQGLFWYKKFLDGRWIWGHQGWSSGIRARIAFDWNNNTGAVVLTNGEDITSVTDITMALLNYAGQYGVAESRESLLPASAVLNQNIPNPFRGSTKISFVLRNKEDVTLKIYNVLGQELITLVDGELEQGAHNIVWTVSELPSGVYYYRLSIGIHEQIRRCVLLN
ncbi:MAG: serine hydrolase [candidate division WOR-3 bacterium]|nr:MAG: serine hydrolase [candidate division WOR-3 bacterium]